MTIYWRGYPEKLIKNFKSVTVFSALRLEALRPGTPLDALQQNSRVLRNDCTYLLATVPLSPKSAKCVSQPMITKIVFVSLRCIFSNHHVAANLFLYILYQSKIKKKEYKKFIFVLESQVIMNHEEFKEEEHGELTISNAKKMKNIQVDLLPCV